MAEACTHTDEIKDVKAKTRLDAIITVVDAKHLLERLEDSPEAADQIAFADVIVLNKLDLVTPEELKAVEARIRQINRFADIHKTTRSDVPADPAGQDIWPDMTRFRPFKSRIS